MRGRDRSTVVMTAREAAQTAEDARAIALARKQEEEIALARAEVANERQLRLQAEAEVQRARSEVTANREMLDAERVRARGAAPGYNVLPAPPPVESEAVVKPPLTADRQQNEIRVRVLHDLRGAFPVLDSPRGLVVTVPDSAFRGSDLTPAANSAIERIAAVLVNNRGLVVGPSKATPTDRPEATNSSPTREKPSPSATDWSVGGCRVPPSWPAAWARAVR